MPLPLLGLAVSGAQSLLGLGQTIAANRKKKQALAEYNANPYQTPESQIRSTNIAARTAQGTDLPAQDLMEERLASETAQTVAQARRAASSPSQVLAATVAAYEAEQKNRQNLDLQAAQSYQQRQAAYQNALVQLSPYEDARWRNNILFPTQAKLNEASGMGASGMSNIGSGISGALSMYANQKYLDSLKTPQTNVGSVNSQYDNTPSMGMQPMSPITPLGSGNVSLRNPWWNGGVADNSIQKRQGNY